MLACKIYFMETLLKKNLCILFFLIAVIGGNICSGRSVSAATKSYYTKKYYRAKKYSHKKILYTTYYIKYLKKYKQKIIKKKKITQSIVYYKHKKTVKTTTKRKTIKKNIKYSKRKMSIRSVKKELPSKVYQAFINSGYKINTNPADPAFDSYSSEVNGVFVAFGEHSKIAVREYDKEVLLHELGHFLDYRSKWASDRKKFKKIHKQEKNKYKRGKSPTSLKKKSVEYFAECFKDFCINRKQLRKTCPKTEAYIKKIVLNAK